MTSETYALGAQVWFEYHCWESPASHDALAWYHSHQQVTVLALHTNDSEGMTRVMRDESGMPFTYTVRFDDGLEWCAFEDELTDTPDSWQRPDPPTSDLHKPTEGDHDSND